MPLQVLDKEKNKEKKRRITDFLRNEGILLDHDVGQIVLHVNDGGITKVTKNIDVLK